MFKKSLIAMAIALVIGALAKLALSNKPES